MNTQAATAVLLIGLVTGCCYGQPPSRVAKRVLRADVAQLRERLANSSFETAGDDTGAAAWAFWQEGFEVATNGAHGGERCVRCSSDDPAERQTGAAQTIALNQTVALPVIAGGWSKAEGVDGAPSAGYSIYVDLTYTDGSNLWGRVSTFSTGTHEWEYRELTIVPEKPIATITVYGLFRGHRGTVYFDDLALREMDLPEGAGVFDGTPVLVEAGEPRAGAGAGEVVGVAGGPRLVIDAANGAMRLTGAGASDPRAGGLVLRDVAANSDFLQPVVRATEDQNGVRLTGTCPELQLELEATLSRHAEALRLDGTVTDLTGSDRAVCVYWVLPLDLVGGEWPDDMRHSRPIEAGSSYGSFADIGAGNNGLMSRYPLAAPSSGDQRLAVATPLDQPRVSRLAYDASSRELYAAFDLGLTPGTARFPSRATFSALVYDFEPAWGFRSALQGYYELFPGCFEKRVKREGIWMPFTDIATVERPESFGFQFHEGNNNVAWDDEHGVDSFVYVEPMSHWMSLAPETPRTYDAAVAQLAARQADPQGPGYEQAQATRSSAVQGPDGRLVCHLLDTPWCNGALFILNPDPDVPHGEAGPNKAGLDLATIEAAFRGAGRPAAPGWAPFGGGYEPAPNEGRDGTAIRCRSPEAGAALGATQTVQLNQQAPRPIVATCWSRAEGVSGAPDQDYSLYLDLRYTDGTPSWGHNAPFAVGTQGWQRVEVRCAPEKPVQSVAVTLLFRGNHSGAVWFDDVALAEEGDDANRVANPSFAEAAAEARQPGLDGTYIDSFEMAATTQNYRREHWAVVEEPLTFSFPEHRVCSLVAWHTYEFARELSRRMHDQGRLLMANAVLSTFGFPAHMLDVMGTETDWGPGATYAPNSDETMNYRRALCYQKPYLLLLNTNYSTFRPEWVDRYFQRCLFYGIFPSFFSHNAADDPYWQNPALYNRDRPLFERTIPVIQALAAAGWEPVPLARSDNPEVWVERYGGPETEALFLTLYNATDSPQEATVALDRQAMRLGPPGARHVRFTGQGCEVGEGDEPGRIVARLGAEQAMCVQLR